MSYDYKSVVMAKKYGKLFAWPANCPIDAQQWRFLAKRYRFTPQELAVSIAVCHGCNNKKVAEKLEIAEYTAETHLRNVYRKVGVNNKVTLLLTFLEEIKKNLN